MDINCLGLLNSLVMNTLKDKEGVLDIDKDGLKAAESFCSVIEEMKNICDIYSVDVKVDSETNEVCFFVESDEVISRDKSNCPFMTAVGMSDSVAVTHGASGKETAIIIFKLNSVFKLQ